MQAAAKNLYAILGVAPDATPEQLHEAYRTAVRLNRDGPEGSEKNARLELIADAYTLLSNPVRRQIYDASLASGESRLIDRKLQPEPQQPDHRGTPAIKLNDNGLFSQLDAERIRLWRKILTFGLVLALPLLYFYRQSQLIQLQTQFIRGLEQPPGPQPYVAGRNRAADFRAFNEAKIRLVEIEEKLQELGPAGADRSVADNQEINALNEEKQRLQDIVRAVAEKYGRP